MIDYKQRLATLTGLAWGGATTVASMRVADVLPQRYTPVLVVLVGLAVWGGMSLSRLRLTETITAVFTAGIHAAELRQRERTERIIERHDHHTHDSPARASDGTPHNADQGS